MKQIFTFILCFGLIACGGRAPQQIQTHNSYDDRLSCIDIAKERSSLNTMNIALEEEIKSRDTKNLIIGSLGWILIFIPYAFFDVSDSIEIDQMSVFYRLKKLRTLEQKLNCPAS